MAAVNHNARVLKALRDTGYHAEVTERWDGFSRRRHDLFGFIDVLAVGHHGTLAIQVTSRANMASRRHKITESPILSSILGAGWKVQIWGYDKPASRWRLKVEEVK
jgi:hypothetical protein